MSVAERAQSKLPRLLRTVSLFAAGYAVDFGLLHAEGWLNHLASVLFWDKGTTDYFYAQSAAWFVIQVHEAFSSVLYLATVVALVGVFVRPVWQRRVLRSGAGGSLAEAARKHPVVADRVLPWGAGLAWLGLSIGLRPGLEFIARLAWGRSLASSAHDALQDLSWALSRANILGYLLGSVIAVTGIAAATRFAIRRIARDPEARAPVPELAEDQTSFAAVAVTASTRGAVAALAVLSVLVGGLAAEWDSLATLAPVIFAYILAALGVATLFRRMSRIVVGIDGILVLGADKARFIAYAGLDGVKANGSDIFLQHRGKTTLRLQLHDDDVTRAPALTARIQAAMDQSTRMRGEGADRLMQAQGTLDASERLASSSRGGLDYRQPAIAREQLWELVEGPVSDANARRVAAEALAPDMSREEKERLRVVVEKCAEPRARVALQRLLDRDPEDEGETDELEPAIVPRRRFT